MGSGLRLLLVEDSEDDAELTLLALTRAGFDVTHTRVQTREDMRRALRAEPWDVIVSDYSMPSFSAPEAFATLTESGLDVPFLIVSGTVGEETAVQAMRMGVNDYLLKGALHRLGPAIERELRECQSRKARREAEQARQQAEASLRETEGQLRHAQKMEAVGRLAGGVAHDFNNLLSVILSYTTFAMDGIPPSDPLREDLETVKRAAGRAAELTRQLLAFSRQQVLQPRVLDLADVVRDVQPMLRRIVGEDVAIDVSPSRAGGKVYADPGQVEQVIMNLVINARDAMPQGGRIAIEVRDAVLPSQQADCVMLAISDTGTGMDKETMAKIFEPFFTTKPKDKGTGLGLSTVYGIVKQSGGDVEVDSELAKGTTFKIYFPRTRQSESALPAASAAPRALRGTETVLIVEDDDDVRGIMCTTLRRQGYNVLEAQNGGEALLICGKFPGKIDLLVSDVIMPRMSGRELVDRIKPLRPATQIMFVSGYTENAILSHGALDSGVAFFQKPITPEAFAAKVRDVLTAPAPGSMAAGSRAARA